MPKRGRPTIPRFRIRSNAVLVKLTDTEKARLVKLAQARGVTMNDYLRYASGIADPNPMVESQEVRPCST